MLSWKSVSMCMTWQNFVVNSKIKVVNKKMQMNVLLLTGGWCAALIGELQFILHCRRTAGLRSRSLNKWQTCLEYQIIIKQCSKTFNFITFNCMVYFNFLWHHNINYTHRLSWLMLMLYNYFYWVNCKYDYWLRFYWLYFYQNDTVGAPITPMIRKIVFFDT